MNENAIPVESTVPAKTPGQRNRACCLSGHCDQCPLKDIEPWAELDRKTLDHFQGDYPFEEGVSRR